MSCATVIVKCRKCGPLNAHLDLTRPNTSKKTIAALVKSILALHMEVAHGAVARAAEKKAS